VGQSEDSGRVFSRGRDHLLDGEASQFGYAFRDQPDKGRLVSLSPVRHRRQVGSIGLNQDPVQRDVEDGLVQAPVLEGHHPTEGDIVAVDQPRSQEGGTAAERVEDAGDTGMRSEDGGDVVVGLAGVNHRGLTGLGGETQLGFERGLLAGSGAVVVMVVEAGLPDRDDLFVPQPLPQGLFGIRRPRHGVMGMNARRGGESGLGSRQRQGPVGRLRRLTNHHHPLYSSRPGPSEHLVAVGVVGGIREVAVGVDEHRCLMS
jgi:hypothetical protein